MTLWAQRKNATQVDVTCTYGPVTFSVTEDIGGIRSIHDQLGKILADQDQPVSRETEGA